MTITLLPRSSWSNRNPRTNPQPMTSFTDGWFVHWLGAANPAGASDVDILRSTQRYHMDAKGWNDIAYSFAIGRQRPDVVYTLRGWGIQGGHTEGYNRTSMAVVFLLGPGETPTPQMLATCAEFLRTAPRIYAAPPAQVRPHRAVRSTDCPGPDLAAWVEAGLPITSPGGPTDMTPAQTAAVRQLQADLNSWGVDPPLVVDGDPGPKTVTALQSVLAYASSEIDKARSYASSEIAKAQAATAAALDRADHNQAAADLLARVRALWG